MVEWFNNLSNSDRRVLTLSAILIIPLVLYATIIAPLEQKIDRYSLRLSNAQNSVDHLLKIVAEYQQFEGNKIVANQPKNNASLLFIVDKTSKALQVKKSITRVTPVGGNKVRIEFKNAHFDHVISWLVLLAKKEAIQIEMIRFNQSNKPGTVSGKLSLFRQSIEEAG